MKKITYQNISEHLVREIPEFKDRVSQHIKEQCGTVLPHVLFEDLARFVVEVYRNNPESKKTKDILLRNAKFIEDLLDTGDVMIVNLVGVSFLEYNFESNKQYSAGIRKYFFPKTIALLDRIEGKA